MATNEELRVDIAALRAKIALQEAELEAELEMDTVIADAFARGVLLADPNFDWRDLEVQ